MYCIYALVYVCTVYTLVCVFTVSVWICCRSVKCTLHTDEMRQAARQLLLGETTTKLSESSAKSNASKRLV